MILTINISLYSCRPQEEVFWYGYVVPIGITTVITWVFHLYTLVVLLTFKDSNDQDTVVPSYFASVILHLSFAIIWAIALMSTDDHITGMFSTVTHYVFTILAAMHGLAILILTLLRAKDIRNAGTCRTTGKYDISGGDMIKNDLAFGLESSGKSPEEIVNEGSTDKEIVDTKVSTGIILKQ